MPQQSLQNHFSGHRGGWATSWLVEEMMDGQHQRVDIPAHARTAHKGLLLKRLEEDLCWIIPHVPLTTQLVKGLTELVICSQAELIIFGLKCSALVWQQQPVKDIGITFHWEWPQLLFWVFCYHYALSVCSMSLFPRPSLTEGGPRICDMRNNLCACCTQEGKAGAAESMTWKNY